MIRFRYGAHLRAGFDSVRGAKFRSFWTMLGIIIGVMSVISIVGIGQGIKNQIGGQIHGYGADLITVRPTSLQLSSSASSATNINTLAGLSVSGPLTNKDINTVSQTYGVGSSAPLTLLNGKVKGPKGAYQDGFIIGTSEELPGLLNQSMQYGNMFNSGDNGGYVAVLGEHAAESLFNEDVPLGSSFSFHGHSFIVEGIFNEFNITPLSQQADFNNAIFIPNAIAESLTNSTAPTYEILARPSNSTQTQLVANNIQAALNSSHGGQSGFTVRTGNQNLDDNNNVLDLLTKLIAGVAAISLLVAGIGIMNVMLVSVSERVREIGIRKAVGATNRQILGQFMVEAGLISFVGGLLGIGLAYLIDLVMRAATNLTPDISWQIVAIASGVSLLVGIVFGTVPAIKAARKDPIEALRAE